MDVTILLFSILFSGAGTNQVLLVSMDGFRWDYLNRVPTPNFDRLARHGTKIEYIDNTFVTETFPCHYSIATGLFEESHGIIGNFMYDPVFNTSFDFNTREPRWWNGAEPIWVTARRQNLTSASYGWPGGDVVIRGFRPNIWFPYSKTVQFRDRIDVTIDWLTVKKIDFVALYFQEPDPTGHQYGIYSNEILEKVKELDNSIGYLLDKFDSQNLWGQVNLIVTSDHGMTGVDYVNKAVDIRNYVNMTNIRRTVESGPVMHIQPVDGKVDEVIQSLYNVRHMTAYKKADIPERWHFKNNRRVMPIFLLAERGWLITTNKTELAIYYGGSGAHGYDNKLLSMKPIFIARGPNITENHVAPTIRNIDIYPMICKLLGIEPSPNNGSLQATSNFLVNNKHVGVGGIVG
ncbi:ENPP5 [Mytilus coruscus]|uniref:ENPP5 n=1 Tax=Mytilus coruscus TaxID=42192 RepID=A0A6J8BV57_MYTCO|nr:ENPP5 [Mytilus coruscus]